MRRGTLTLLFFIILLAAGAAYVVFWPTASQNGGKPLYGINNPFTLHLGLDLQGGVRVLLQPAPGENPTDENMATARTLIEQRVNKGLGVNEPVVRTQSTLDGQKSIIVELPGYNSSNQKSDIESLLRTGKLEIWNTGSTPLNNGDTLDPAQFASDNNGSEKPLFVGSDLDPNSLNRLWYARRRNE
jgi:preprotein translocase subunit SecD